MNRRQVAFGPVADTLTADRLRATYGAGAVQLVAGSTIVQTS